MRIVGKRSAFPPLGLLTVAAMLPATYEKKLIDMNVTSLENKDILWADYVFISAMIAQGESAKQVIKQCNRLGAKVVAGGPLFTTGHESFEGVDHFILGEAEDTLPIFLSHLESGSADSIYASKIRPDVTKTPIPLWELINPGDYASLSLQYSRGCPFDCEFCDIIVMNGRIPRVKSTDQVLAELSAIYRTGFCGTVLFVDDNFIGNKVAARKMLPRVIQWQEARGFPFTFATEASMNLADDEELMNLMARAGFDQVFLGLETPSPEALSECGKVQNTKRNLVDSISRIQQHGFHTHGGFIVGFDSDSPDIFDRQIKFIQESGVVVAMVGLLQALPKTRLHERLSQEGRILDASSGNNTDGSTNFVTKMDSAMLANGYKKIIATIYSPDRYYVRMCRFLDNFKPCRKSGKKIDWFNGKTFIRSLWYIGLVGPPEYRRCYWKMLFTAFFKYRKAFSEAVAMTIYGFHLYQIAKLQKF
jgi:radical SAM superfamily enzyme YgiQ (UPF0313 family)